MSPPVAIVKRYRISVYANDHPPPHVHVEKGGKAVKVTLSPVTVIKNRGFNQNKMREIVSIVRDNKGHCWEIWHQVHST